MARLTSFQQSLSNYPNEVNLCMELGEGILATPPTPNDLLDCFHCSREGCFFLAFHGMLMSRFSNLLLYAY